MMNFDELKLSIKKLQTEQDILKGKLEAGLEDLTNLGFNSVKDAEIWVEEETVRLEKKTAEFNNQLEEFHATYHKYLT